MVPIDRLIGCILVSCLVAVSLLSGERVKPRIVPLRAVATFSSKLPGSRWSVPIKSTAGNTAYVLSLEPDFDVGRHIVVLNLVLRHPGDNDDAPNLLDPTGIWHGIQPCDFVAKDLVGGAHKSVFGERRVLSVKSLNLAVRMVVSKVAVSPISADDYQFDSLDLQVDVDNSKP
jgi:hypothetical protein